MGLSSFFALWHRWCKKGVRSKDYQVENLLEFIGDGGGLIDTGYVDMGLTVGGLGGLGEVWRWISEGLGTGEYYSYHTQPLTCCLPSWVKPKH